LKEDVETGTEPRSNWMDIAGLAETVWFVMAAFFYVIATFIGHYIDDLGWPHIYEFILPAIFIGLVFAILSAQLRKRRLNRRAEAAKNLAQAQKALSTTEQRFKDVAESASDWIWEMDADLRFNFFSGRLKEIVGIDPDSLIGKGRKHSISSIESAELWENHQDDLDNRRPFRDFRYWIDVPGKGPQYVSISGKPIYDEQGNFAGYRGMGSNITKQYEQQCALKNSEQRFKDFAEVASDWFWESGPDHRITYISKRVEDKTGGTKESIIGKSRLEVAAQDLEDKKDEKWQQHQKDLEDCKEFRDFTYVYQDENGKKLYLETSGKPFFADDGTFLGYRGVGSDISKLVEHQKEIERSEQRFKDFAEVASDWFWETDADLRYTFLSAHAESLNGAAPERVYGKRREELVSPEDIAQNPEEWNQHLRHLENREPFKDFEYRYQRPDGLNTYIRVSGKPIYDEDGQFTGYRGIGTNVTKEHENREALRRAKEDAETANKTKSDFLASMSHELRTPLNAIIGYSDAMRSEVFGPLGNERYRDYPIHIYDSGTHLLELINDVLDVSKIEAGKLDLHDEVIPVEGIATSVLRLVRERAESGKIKLANELPNVLPRLRADPLRVKQMLLNLLSNAVKFTPEGGCVTLGCQINGNGEFVLSVTDTGIGMGPEEQKKALSQFGQVDSDLSRKFQGTGLGLPLTIGLIELHGGYFDIRSAPGKGTMTALCFPSDRVVI